MATRKIRFVKFTDGNVSDFVDDGCDKKGNPNQARQTIERQLQKMVVVGSGDEAMRYPLWRLYEPPPPMKYNLADRNEAQVAAADKFDIGRVLREGGKWILPDAEWKAASAKACAQRAAKEQEQADAFQVSNNAKAGEILSQLLDTARQGKVKRAKSESASDGAGSPQG